MEKITLTLRTLTTISEYFIAKRRDWTTQKKSTRSKNNNIIWEVFSDIRFNHFKTGVILLLVWTFGFEKWLVKEKSTTDGIISLLHWISSFD